jgi:hypothetical protein
VAKRKSEQEVCEAIDIKALRQALLTEDAEERARAVRKVCPCRLGFDVFEEFMAIALQLQKDPDPTVRAAAIHVFEDAYQMMSSGQPTSRRMVTNDMLATKIRSRGRREEEEPKHEKAGKPRQRR